MLDDLINAAKAQQESTKKGKFIIIAAEPGMGKTALASTFDKPIFIRAEDGISSIHLEQMPDYLPVLTPQKGNTILSQLKMQVGAIRKSKQHKTVVLDTLSTLNNLIIDCMTLQSDESDFEKIGGGYGKCYNLLAQTHAEVATGLGRLVEDGFDVVVLCHVKTEMMRTPDLDDYMAYKLALTDGNKQHSSPHYLQRADLVCCITSDRSIDKKTNKATGGAGRIIHMSPVGGFSFCKNRDNDVNAPSIIPFFRDNKTGKYINPFNKSEENNHAN